MSKTYAQNLAELKEVLPRGYQVKIVERSGNLTMAQVKMAFAGTLQDEETLRIVLHEAQQLQEDHLEDMKAMTNRTNKLIKQAKKIA